MKKVNILFSVLILSAQILYATVTVDGFCYLENTTVHSGTKVLFFAVSASANTDSTYTNADGSFMMGLSVGIYTVNYSHDGWQPYSIPGDIPFFEDTTLDDITLSSGGVEEVYGPQNGIWTSDCIYQVIGDITVNNGDTLVIEPGVIVKFMDNYSFNISGKLVAEGTETDTIRFTSGQTSCNPGDWNQIKFESSSDSNSVITYVKIEYANNGIYCDSSSPTISHNTISNNNEEGIYCVSSSPTISNNTISNNNEEGIYCVASSPNISNNTINNNSNSGIRCPYYSFPTISNNTISNNYWGIECENYSSPSISHNMISNNIAFGVYCVAYSSPTISNNTISNSVFGICIDSSSPYIINNILYDNNYGIRAYSSPSSVEFNLFWLNTNVASGNLPPYFGQIITVNANGDSCDTYCNLFMDPLFVEPDSLNYHLKENSPCIDAGDPNSPPDPDGTVADIGAFYYHQYQQSIEGTIVLEGGSGVLTDVTVYTDGHYTNPSNSGYYSISLPAGIYDVTASLINYSDTTKTNIVVTENQITSGVDFILYSLEPIANFYADPIYGCEPLMVQFTDLSTNNPTSWLWQFGDGSTSIDQNPNYEYNNWGEYTISLTATNNCGSDTETKIDYIVVNGIPIADAGDDQIVLENEVVYLDGSRSYDPEGEDLNYHWVAPVGIVLSDSTIVNPTFIAPDIDDSTYYAFTLTVDDGECYSNLDRVIITVINNPVSVNEIFPNEFELIGSYPNPIRDRAEISFGIPERSYIKIELYDMRGHFIEILMSKDMNAGYHKIECDMSSLKSGIYFYKMSVDGVDKEIKKVILLR